ncbi:MAG TPA: hemerythrin domain-containing protein [Bdellovibrionales bacterium]|nr:hemerythrin domain-containing protein [Bdellovibrionales bacterium]
MAAGKKTKKSATKSKKSARQNVAAESGEADIIELILTDHEPLKELIEILKDTENDLEERRDAFEQFGPLLVSHAKTEENILYEYLKEDEDLREEGFEGDVEHQLADQMLEEAKRTDDEDLWSARVKVLAELVEHHIEEEEEEMLPEFKKHSEKEDRIELGAAFTKLKNKIESEGLDDISAKKFAEAHERVSH